MKKINLLVLSILLSFTVVAQQKNYQIASLAFYNLENLFDPADDPKKFDEEFTPAGANHYTEEIYRRKLHNMALVLSKIAVDKTPDGPVFFGVAEVENEKVLQDLVKEPELEQRHYQVVHFESPDTRGIDVGLLYNPTYFKVLDAQALPVILMQNNKREYTRDILYVKGIFAGTDTLHVMVGHWPSRRGGESASMWKRKVAAEVCRTKADEILKQDAEAKIVIMGDLNDDPISPSVMKILGAKGDQKEVNRGELFNPWMSFYKKGIGTLGYNDSWNLFDQIIISSGFLKPAENTWKYYKAEIFKEAFLVDQFGQYKGYPHRSYSYGKWVDGYSDHFPTYIYLIKEVK